MSKVSRRLMQIWIKKNKNKLIFYLNFNFFFPKFKSKLLNTEISIKHLILIKYTTKKFNPLIRPIKWELYITVII